MNKQILFVTTSPTVNGSGDALVAEAMRASQNAGAECQRINFRDVNINYCKGCYCVY